MGSRFSTLKFTTRCEPHAIIGLPGQRLGCSMQFLHAVPVPVLAAGKPYGRPAAFSQSATPAEINVTSRLPTKRDRGLALLNVGLICRDLIRPSSQRRIVTPGRRPRPGTIAHLGSDFATATPPYRPTSTNPQGSVVHVHGEVAGTFPAMRTRFLTVGGTPGIDCLGSAAKARRTHEVRDGMEPNRRLKKAQRNASSRKLLNLALSPSGDSRPFHCAWKSIGTIISACTRRYRSCTGRSWRRRCAGKDR